MRVLVFGATGWLGHNIALAFAAAGHEVTACSRGKKRTYAAAVAGMEFLQADKDVPSELERLFAARHFDVVVDSVPQENCLRGIAKHARGLKQYIHCSSTGGYAPLPFVPCDETAYYGGFAEGWMLKRVLDNLALELCHEQGFPATVLRPCYISGPGMLPLDNLGGRREDFIADLIAETELDVVNDGQALLQPVHVHDLAHAFLLAAERPLRSVGQIYNICLDRAVTLNRYLEITAAALGVKPRLKHLPLEEMLATHAGHIHEVGLRFMALHMCFDITKAKEQLGYQPAHSVEGTIEENARWAAQQLHQDGRA